MHGKTKVFVGTQGFDWLIIKFIDSLLLFIDAKLGPSTALSYIQYVVGMRFR